MTSKLIAVAMTLPFIATALFAQLESDPIGAVQGFTFAGAAFAGYRIHTAVVEKMLQSHAEERKQWMAAMAAASNSDAELTKKLLERLGKQISEVT